MRVHETKNYDKFSFIKGNRPINKAHLKRLEKSYEDSGPLVAITITNEKFWIIDGQHRFIIHKKLGLPISYITKQGYGLSHVHIYNQNSSDWNTTQFMNSYADMGMEEYKVYRFFKNRYAFGHGETMTLLSGNSNARSKFHYDKFKKGKFEIIDLAFAQEVADKIRDFGEYYEGFKRRAFIFAVLSIVRTVQGYDHSQMLHKLSYQSNKLQDQVKKEHYLSVLEKIYNYRTRTKYLRFDLSGKA